MPAFAKYVCGGKRSTRPAGASSTFSGSFNLNPAGAPTEPSPYGIETISSYIRKENPSWSPQFSVIKGFKKFGSGVSTSGSNTFYSNDIVQRTRGHANIETFDLNESAKGKVPNLNLGTAIPLNPSKKGDLDALKLGVTLRYNQMTDSLGGGFGLSGGNSSLTYGVGITRESVSNLLPRMYFGTFSLSFRLWFLELEYAVLKHYEGLFLPPVQIGTVTMNMGRLMLTAAMRRVFYELDGLKNQPHFGLQFALSQRLTLGCLFNFIPGTNSLALQIFL